jgi:hypothetical protein
MTEAFKGAELGKRLKGSVLIDLGGVDRITLRRAMAPDAAEADTRNEIYCALLEPVVNQVSMIRGFWAAGVSRPSRRIAASLAITSSSGSSTVSTTRPPSWLVNPGGVPARRRDDLRRRSAQLPGLRCAYAETAVPQRSAGSSTR